MSNTLHVEDARGYEVRMYVNLSSQTLLLVTHVSLGMME